MTVHESVIARWQRRAVTIPGVLAATVVAVGGFWMLAPLAAVSDLVRMRRRLPTLRLYLFAVQYLINDTVEILLAPLLWLRAGFGRRLDSASSIARHARLQAWSLRLLKKRADQLLGLRIEIEAGASPAFDDGPVIVLGRHISPLDASLPAIVYLERGFAVRGVIMAEMLWDPGFDLLYGRLGSIFIPRGDPDTARAAVEQMAVGIDRATAVGIFPEGRLFRADTRDRLLARLETSDPERGARLAGITHLLPPRPGGLLVLLDALPDADVVVMDHKGLEPVTTWASLVASVPLEEPIRVRLDRIPRSEIPRDREGRIRWLDEKWIDLDQRRAGQLVAES